MLPIADYVNLLLVVVRDADGAQRTAVCKCGDDSVLLASFHFAKPDFPVLAPDLWVQV